MKTQIKQITIINRVNLFLKSTYCLFQCTVLVQLFVYLKLCCSVLVKRIVKYYIYMQMRFLIVIGYNKCKTNQSKCIYCTFQGCSQVLIVGRGKLGQLSITSFLQNFKIEKYHCKFLNLSRCLITFY